MYPSPNKFKGSRKELIHAYVTQTSQTNLIIPKKNKNTFRICSYNVKNFDFVDQANKKIATFIDNLDPDVYSLIEYLGSNDTLFKLRKGCLFEQVEDYGIYSFGYNVQNSRTCDSTYMLRNCSGYSQDENRGFTCVESIFNDRPITIITIHLDVSDNSAYTRQQEIKDVIGFILSQKLKNVIVIGDFNEYYMEKNNPLYLDYLEEFKERVGLDEIPNKTHTLLKQVHFENIYELFENSPQFSCWSGKLVDFCYFYKPTWDKSLYITDFYMPFINYSDHLPLIVDISYK